MLVTVVVEAAKAAAPVAALVVGATGPADLAAQAVPAGDLRPSRS